MTYIFIAGRCGDLPVAVCCRVMKVSTSGFNAWRAQPCSDRDWDDALLTNTIVDVHHMSHAPMGRRRSTPSSASDWGRAAQRKRVERLMRQAGVAGIGDEAAAPAATAANPATTWSAASSSAVGANGVGDAHPLPGEWPTVEEAMAVAEAAYAEEVARDSD